MCIDLALAQQHIQYLKIKLSTYKIIKVQFPTLAMSEILAMYDSFQVVHINTFGSIHELQKIVTN